MIHYLIGDATYPHTNGPAIIAHVVNDAGKWGKGFVLALSKRWRKPQAMYHGWRLVGNGFALGATQLVQVEPTIWVANMVAQHGIGVCNGVIPLRYEALAQCLRSLRVSASLCGKTVHMPRIGCGLGGSTWDKVEPIIRHELDGIDVFVYDLEPHLPRKVYR